MENNPNYLLFIKSEQVSVQFLKESRLKEGGTMWGGMMMRMEWGRREVLSRRWRFSRRSSCSQPCALGGWGVAHCRRRQHAPGPCARPQVLQPWAGSHPPPEPHFLPAGGQWGAAPPERDATRPEYNDNNNKYKRQRFQRKGDMFSLPHVVSYDAMQTLSTPSVATLLDTSAQSNTIQYYTLAINLTYVKLINIM